MTPQDVSLDASPDTSLEKDEPVPETSGGNWSMAPRQGLWVSEGELLNEEKLDE